MDFNTVLSINQTVHNLGAVLFGAGPFYLLLFILKRRRATVDITAPLDDQVEAVFSTAVTLWMAAIVVQAISGVSFGLISLIYEGALPQIAPVARAALAVKILGALAAFAISFYMRARIVPGLKRLSSGEGPGKAGADEALRLRRSRETLLWILFFLAVVILTGAAFLRWNI